MDWKNFSKASGEGVPPKDVNDATNTPENHVSTADAAPGVAYQETDQSHNPNNYFNCSNPRWQEVLRDAAKFHDITGGPEAREIATTYWPVYDRASHVKEEIYKAAAEALVASERAAKLRATPKEVLRQREEEATNRRLQKSNSERRFTLKRGIPVRPVQNFVGPEPKKTDQPPLLDITDGMTAKFVEAETAKPDSDTKAAPLGAIPTSTSPTAPAAEWVFLSSDESEDDSNNVGDWEML